MGRNFNDSFFKKSYPYPFLLTRFILSSVFRITCLGVYYRSVRFCRNFPDFYIIRQKSYEHRTPVWMRTAINLWWKGLNVKSAKGVHIRSGRELTRKFTCCTIQTAGLNEYAVSARRLPWELSRMQGKRGGVKLQSRKPTPLKLTEVAKAPNVDPWRSYAVVASSQDNTTA